MVVLTEQVEIPAFYEKMEAWTANFEEEFVKCSTAALRNEKVKTKLRKFIKNFK